MTQFTCYRLTFPDGLHLDAGSCGSENTEVSIHSDTLFSALCCAANLLDGDDGVAALVDNAVISSAFPFAGRAVPGKEEYEYFFPKPMTLRGYKFKVYSNEKKFRKLKYLSQSRWEQDLQGELDLDAFDEVFVKNGSWFAEKPDDDFQIYRLSERPRITTDRTTQAAEIFHFSEVHFSEHCGLFFLADFSGNKDFQKTFETYLHLLADEGIGADSAVGKGIFGFEKSEGFAINVQTNQEAWLMLSLYSPKEDEVKRLRPYKSHYEILTRRGWMSAPGLADWRRRSLQMFGEGSVISFESGQKPEGHIPQVLKKTDKVGETAPAFDVYRYGKAFCVPIKL